MSSVEVLDIKNKKEDEFISLFLDTLRPSASSLSRLSESNRISLREMISFLTKLKNEKTIDDKQYADLVIMACANYIENEVEFRIAKSINERITIFFEKI